MMEFNLKIPNQVTDIASKLNEAGYEAYIVGGCVRDLILNLEPKDWDITTNALPEEVQKIFPHTVYKNEFGTVGIVLDGEDDPLKLIEVTTYRSDSEYLDSRRPKEVIFHRSISKDLERRDFTINAIAYDPIKNELVDENDGIKDLNKGKIRTVGDPDTRFMEDGLRLMRAVRIATQLDGEIEEKTLKSIQKNAKIIGNVAAERIRDELIKILETDKPMVGILLLEKTGLLKHIIPELRSGIGIEQNQAHKYDVFEHNLRTLEHSGTKNLKLILRLSSLMHDISKPETREWSKEKGDWTFYNHEVVGAKVAKKIMRRLCFSNEITESVRLLVRWHMFFSDVEKITLSGVRRMVARVGEEKIWELIDLRMCDRIGTGRPKEQPYRLRKYISMVEEVLREPITPGVLTVDGDEIMKCINEKPSKKIGDILHALLAEVLENPSSNEKKYLLDKAKELSKLDEEDLKKLGEKGRNIKVMKEMEEIGKIRKKYGVN